jgi:hypothetical protein
MPGLNGRNRLLQNACLSIEAALDDLKPVFPGF